MFARIRKAVIAGVGAGLAAAVGVLLEAGVTEDTVAKAAGAGVAAAVMVGVATYRVPNKQ